MSANPVVSEALPPEPPRGRRIPLLLRVAIFFAVLLLSISVYVRFFAPRAPGAGDAAIPVIGHMPTFALTDQTGAPFTDATMRGKVWVADFIFTTCGESCPRLTKKMKHLQTMLEAKRNAANDVRLVSFTVDPENDTPEVLAAYAGRVPTNPAMWSFVTGPSDQVREAIVNGFKMTAQRVEKATGDYDVLHGNWFVLGDRAGNIRGYYEAQTDADIDIVAHDVARLEAETP